MQTFETSLFSETNKGKSKEFDCRITFDYLPADPSVGQDDQIQNVRVYVDADTNSTAYYGVENWIEIKLDHSNLEVQAEDACWAHISAVEDSLKGE